MKFKRALALASGCVFAFLASCAPSKPLVVDASLIPTSGQLAEKRITALPVQFTYNGSGSGDVKVTMPDGEICIGRYTTVASGTNYSHSGSSNFTITDDSYRYGTSYRPEYTGQQTYSSNSAIRSNQQSGRALASGNKGTIVQFEYVTSISNPLHGQGRGFDNRGNKYTMIY
jgi:hypothetical protein